MSLHAFGTVPNHSFPCCCTDSLTHSLATADPLIIIMHMYAGSQQGPAGSSGLPLQPNAPLAYWHPFQGAPRYPDRQLVVFWQQLALRGSMLETSGQARRCQRL